MFSQNLSYLRKKADKTQKELAKELGIAQSTLAGYESGVREPSFETLDLIANYFGVSKASLLGEAELTPALDLQYFAEKKKPTDNGELVMSIKRQALLALVEKMSEEQVEDALRKLGVM